MNKLKKSKKASKSAKKFKKVSESVETPNHKKAFERLLDDAVMGVGKKKGS